MGVGHDRLPAGGVLAGEDEQGAAEHGGLGGVEAEPGDDPPVLEVAEAVLDGARAADRAWLACRWAGVVLRAEVDFQPVMMTGFLGVGV